MEELLTWLESELKLYIRLEQEADHSEPQGFERSVVIESVIEKVHEINKTHETHEFQ